MPPLTSGVQSNTVGPPGSNPPGYFDQAMGSPGSRFDPKMSPYMPSAATITPMTPGPQWQQPYHMGNQLPMPPLPQHAHEMPAHPAPVAELKG
ncbi:Sodium/potassium-transporting ATPase subunit alpha-2 [Venturia nashicola]|uniref:Sodium/potassium-transporting ATPase subunit alpha-2 n=1 Tax=Venturia nashicola TaxID=86259 RepID=A0A4Z1P3I2_9PEZI|nr:Sodium/potassium-transporting ATPase subunit alpha-2 [Venturia nashicola]